MADQRVTTAAVLTDPATSTQQAGVTAGGELKVAVNSALPAGGNNIGDVDVASAPTGAAAIQIQGTAADGVASVGSPVQVGGKDGSGNAQTLSTDATGALNVNVGSPATPTVDPPAAAAAVAAGASADLDSVDLGGSTKRLAGVDISSSVPFKAVVKEVVNAVETVRIRGLFSGTAGSLQWRPPHKDYFSKAFSANAGFDGWRVSVTNLDANDAADFYATFYYED